MPNVTRRKRRVRDVVPEVILPENGVGVDGVAENGRSTRGVSTRRTKRPAARRPRPAHPQHALVERPRVAPEDATPAGAEGQPAVVLPADPAGVERAFPLEGTGWFPAIALSTAAGLLLVVVA